MRGTEETQGRIERELNEERIAALRRISETLDALIAQLRVAEHALRHASATDRSRAVDSYRELRARAMQYRWYLEVQREAMGLRYHHRLDEFYRIPPDVT